MDNTIQTSFIPKKPIASLGHRSEKRPLGVLSFLSFVIVIIIGLLIGGLFIYKNYLIKQKDNLINSLNLSRESFEPKTISEVESFSRKINISKELLRNHLAVSPIFSRLEELTIPTVQFTKFSYQTTDKDFLVQMSGLARDYTSIALEAKEFNSNRGNYFKDVVFSNLVSSNSLNTKDYVSFDISFSVDKGLLAYENNLTSLPSSAGAKP